VLPDSRSIRLLILQPAQSYDDQVVCGLFLTSLDGPAPYETLSYTWGPPFEGTTLKDQVITPQGETYAVTGNQYAALKRLRHNSQPRCLWVDALCIHQGDHSERGRQVRIIHEIYANATQKVAWVGEDCSAHDGEISISFFHQFRHFERTRVVEERMEDAKRIEEVVEAFNASPLWHQCGTSSESSLQPATANFKYYHFQPSTLSAVSRIFLQHVCLLPPAPLFCETLGHSGSFEVASGHFSVRHGSHLDGGLSECYPCPWHVFPTTLTGRPPLRTIARRIIRSGPRFALPQPTQRPLRQNVLERRGTRTEF
jgi:hypothetical protein